MTTEGEFRYTNFEWACRGCGEYTYLVMSSGGFCFKCLEKIEGEKEMRMRKVLEKEFENYKKFHEKYKKFYDHIKAHLTSGLRGLDRDAKVCCKICGKTFEEIVKGES